MCPYFFFYFLITPLFSLTIIPEPFLTILTPNGPVRGLLHEDGTAVFRGIPYAQPPLGTLRFAPPQPAVPWTEILNATEFGKSCVPVLSSGSLFSGEFDYSEDCLTVNVWVPSSVRKLDYLAPVVVFIHGGGFILGSSSHHQASPNPLNFTKKNEIVYVSFNYRLGPFGFLAHPELGEITNFGIRDQILALQWVQDNIQFFHGDPQHVTAFGSSAGAISLCFLLTSPLSKGLFKRVVMQSTICDYNFENLTQAYDQSAQLATAIGCPTNNIACLRNADALVIRDALPSRRGILWTKGAHWFPITEGSEKNQKNPKNPEKNPENPEKNPYNVVAPEHPFHMIQQGLFDHTIDIAVGFTRDEGSLFLFLGFPLFIPVDYFDDLLNRVFETEYHRILTEYFSDGNSDGKIDSDSDLVKMVSRLLSNMWECSTLRLARTLHEKGSRVYVYKFSHVPSYCTSWPYSVLGVFHGTDLFFSLMQIPDTATEEEWGLSNSLATWWGWFVSHKEWNENQPWTNDPNEILRHWPTYKPGDQNTTLLVGINPTLIKSPSYCELWDDIVTPEGLLRSIYPGDEPLISWVMNVGVTRVMKMVLSVTGLVVGVVVVLIGVILVCMKRRRESVKLKKQ